MTRSSGSIETDTGSSADTDAANGITNSTQQAQVLKRLMEADSLLTVSVPTSEDVFLSRILAVDRDRQSLSIDELNPEPGHMLATQQKTLTIAGSLEGVPVEFTAQVVKINRDSGNWYYTLPFPDTLYYAQQRQYHRTYVTLSQRPAVRLNTDTDKFQAELLNVSLGGALAITPAQTNLTTDAQLTCDISFASGVKLQIDATVRHLQADEDGKSVKIGLQFVGLDQQQMQILQRQTAHIERRNMRGS